MEKIETVIDQQVAKEHLRPLLNWALFCVVISAICTGLYILFSILQNNWVDVINIVLVATGGFILLCSIFFVVTYFINLNKVKNLNNVLTCEFFEDHLHLTSYKEDKLIQEANIYYSELIGYKESKNYIFLGLKNNNFITVKKVDFIISFVQEQKLPKIKAMSASRK